MRVYGRGGTVAGARSVNVEDNFGADLPSEAARLYRATDSMLVDEVSRRHLDLVFFERGTRPPGRCFDP